MARRATAVAKVSPDGGSLNRFEQYVRTHEPALRDELVLEHLPMVEKIARRYNNLGEPMEDLVQEGYIGLIKAVDQFNPKMGVKFTTYATHVVSGEIRHHLRDLGRLIKEPAWLVELRFRVNRTAEELVQQLGRTPSPGEIAEQLGIPEEDVAEVASTRSIFQIASLDEGTSGEDEKESPSSLAERVTDVREEFATPFEERVVLRQSIRKLRKLERSVIYHFFYQEHTKTEIARRLGISVNYVSYLISRGLGNLKQILIKDERREAMLRLEFMESRMVTAEGPFDESGVVDEATGVYARPFFTTLLEDEVARANRYGLQFSFLLLTLREWTTLAELLTDDEKDRMLRGIADMLKRTLRDVDRIGYYGQGRFVAILPHTGTTAGIASDRILSSLRVRELRPSRLKSVPPPSLICKTFTFPRDADSVAKMLETAEQVERHVRVGKSAPRSTE